MGTGVALLGWGVTQWMRHHRKTAEDLERERRERLTLRGRICDGTIFDVQEVQANGHHPQQLLIYHYEIGGVAYDASQDITRLRQFVDVHSCRLGLPTSVRYDPHNPGDSIVISESWTGLRS